MNTSALCKAYCENYARLNIFYAIIAATVTCFQLLAVIRRQGHYHSDIFLCPSALHLGSLLGESIAICTYTCRLDLIN